MKLTETFATIIGLGILASCAASKTPDGVAMNGAEAADQVQSDADTRAERLSGQAQILNTESRLAKGAQRKKLADEASQDESDAIAIIRDANNEASAIEGTTESTVGDLENSSAR